LQFILGVVAYSLFFAGKCRAFTSVWLQGGKTSLAGAERKTQQSSRRTFSLQMKQFQEIKTFVVDIQKATDFEKSWSAVSGRMEYVDGFKSLVVSRAQQDRMALLQARNPEGDEPGEVLNVKYVSIASWDNEDSWATWMERESGRDELVAPYLMMDKAVKDFLLKDIETQYFDAVLEEPKPGEDFGEFADWEDSANAYFDG